ncbi:MAG: energy transducer TonB [Vicinamibacterales bacterium]
MIRTALALVLVMSLGGLAGAAAQDTVYDIGTGVTAPKVVREVRPDYPADAKADKVVGRVTLTTVVGADGVPGRIAVEQALDDRLDRAAIAALEQWRFEPGRRAGEAVPVRVTIDFTFTLR